MNIQPLVKVQEGEIPRGTPLFESIVMFENYDLNAALRSQVETGNLENINCLNR